MTMIQTLALSAAGILATNLIAAPASAHHSAAAFDTGAVIKIKGVITEFRWGNPHASIKIRGKAGGGRVSGLWTVGMSAPNALVDDGWTRRTVKPGDEVTLYVNPPEDPAALDDGSRDALYVGVILANGKTLGRVDGKPRAQARSH
jgi:hypothetical protein